MDERADLDVEGFLDVAARSRGLDVPDLLRSVMHVGTLEGDPRFQRLFSRCSPDVIDWVLSLDHRVRVWNPGLHYTFKTKYMGYRREDSAEASTSSERTGVFLSVVPRNAVLVLVLPVDPARFQALDGCRSIAHLGHHGVGDAEFVVASNADVKQFLMGFESWLRLDERS